MYKVCCHPGADLAQGGVERNRFSYKWSNNTSHGCKERYSIGQESDASQAQQTYWYQVSEHTYEDGTIHLEHCVTEDMVADLMTKALAADLHTKHAENATGYGDV